MKSGKVRTAIVLQGGGALGAYECGVLEALYQARGEDFRPAVITGVSIGAVNAAILAGAGVKVLDETWRKRFALLEAMAHSPFPFTHMGPIPWFGHFIPAGQFLPPVIQQYMSMLDAMLAPLPSLLQPALKQAISPILQRRLAMFGHEGMYRWRPEYLYGLGVPAPFTSVGLMAAAESTNSFCDTTPLRETLQEVVKPDKLNDGDSWVVVTAVNVATGQVANFGNTKSLKGIPKDAKDDNGIPFFTNRDRLLIDHILASGSLPPNFPATWVDGGCYWDGGLYLNTPLSIALFCLEHCDPDDPDVEREVIVVELFPIEGRVPTNIPEVVARAFNILFSNRLGLDEFLFSKANDNLDFANDIEELGAAIEKLDASNIREDPQLQDLARQIDALKARTGHITEHRGFKEIRKHKKIDYYTRIPFTADPGLGNASDFSEASIVARIQAGKQEAEQRQIGQPKRVP